MKFIAHRGLNNHQYAENTLDAIKQSLKETYINGVEFDIRITKDKKIVLIHDSTINRTSDGNGFVSDMTLSELQQYNFGTISAPSKITTLEEVINSVKTSKKILIEFKHDNENFEELVDNTIKILSKNKSLNYYLCSFSKTVMNYIKLKYPTYLNGLIVNTSKIDNDFCFYAVSYKRMKEEWQKNNKKIFLWTVNNVKDYKMLKSKYPRLEYITDNASNLVNK